MSNKLMNIIILISISISISNGLDNQNNDEGVYIELPKYGEVEFNKQSWLYLNLKDFEKGDKIHLALIFTTGILSYNEVPILLSETNNYKETNKTNNKIITDNNCFQEIDGYTIDHSCNYYYELIGNFQYLVIITPKFDTNIFLIGNQTISHERDDLEMWIIIGIVGFLIIFLIIVIIIYLRKKHINTFESLASSEKISGQLIEK